MNNISIETRELIVAGIINNPNVLSVTDDGSVIEVELKSDCFIVPNRGVRLKNIIFYPERTIEHSQKICNMNGCDFDTEHDWLIQLWYTVKGLSDNVPDHGMTLYKDDRYCLAARTDGYRIPAKFFEGHNEGDTVTVRLPAYASLRDRASDDDKLKKYDINNMIIKYQMKLNQKDHRYCSFGSFEEVFNLVKPI